MIILSELVKYKLILAKNPHQVNDTWVFDRFPIRVTDEQLTFSIGNIKSREISVAYFKFYGYDLRGNLLCEYTSPRWVILTEYSKQSHTFNVKELLSEDKDITDIDSFYMEMYTIGVDSENPLYMNQLMLANGTKDEYHRTNEEKTGVSVGFNNNRFINLYDTSNTFLQIIRPVKEAITTETLTPSQCTILVPHLDTESEWDSSTAILYEYMYQIEQVIGIEK